MNKPTEVFATPCRKFTGQSGEVPACPSDCPCDGGPQFVRQHSAGNVMEGMPTAEWSTAELQATADYCAALHAQGSECVTVFTHVLRSVLDELLAARKLLSKAASGQLDSNQQEAPATPEQQEETPRCKMLSFERLNNQPEPVQWLEGQPIDLSRIQRAVIQPGANGLNMALAQVSGVESIFPYNEQVLKDWATIRRAQVWGKK